MQFSVNPNTNGIKLGVEKTALGETIQGALLFDCAQNVIFQSAIAAKGPAYESENEAFAKRTRFCGNGFWCTKSEHVIASDAVLVIEYGMHCAYTMFPVSRQSSDVIRPLAPIPAPRILMVLPVIQGLSRGEKRIGVLNVAGIVSGATSKTACVVVPDEVKYM